MGAGKAVVRMRLAAMVLEHADALLQEALPQDAPEEVIAGEVRGVLALALSNFDAQVLPLPRRRSDPILGALMHALPVFLDAMSHPERYRAPEGAPTVSSEEPAQEEEPAEPVVTPPPDNGAPDADA